MSIARYQGIDRYVGDTPIEGGANNLPLTRRRDLLVRFLPNARLIDVELSSTIALSPVLKRAHDRKVQVILSRHDFRISELAALQVLVDRAYSLGANISKLWPSLINRNNCVVWSSL